MKQLSIYIHIPFCVQKCLYCDFLSKPANGETREKYVAALKKEIELESIKYKAYEVNTVFFGGGTPTVLEGKQLREILESIKHNYTLGSNAEITTEMNPATADYEKLEAIYNAGINRLSIGLQSANNSELKMLGRIHTYEDFVETYTQARNVGFKNINIDIMSALPGQSYETYMNTLDKVIALRPEHISAYSLIVEENTFLCQNIASFPSLPSEEADRKMYKDTKMKLKNAGYERYEISNYSKQGQECRHNLVYWERGNYVGFGVGAASLVENIRWKNADDINKYISDGYEKEDIENLSIEDQMEEFMFLGLRKIKGISKQEFKESFQKSIDEVYLDVLNKWIKAGYLMEEEDRIFFSEKGIDVSNQILAEFLF